MGTKESIFDQLRKAVLSTGMTQTQLAEFCGISNKHLSQMLRHNVGNLDTVDMVLDVCGFELIVSMRQTLIKVNAEEYVAFQAWKARQGTQE